MYRVVKGFCHSDMTNEGIPLTFLQMPTEEYEKKEGKKVNIWGWKLAKMLLIFHIFPRLH